jgi:hypothetical protein
MREPILAFYQYPFPEGTVYFARHLNDAETIVELFGHACAGAARITPAGWQHLWAVLGLAGLTAVARQAEAFGDADADDESIANELVRRSMLAGYDPVSGFFGVYSEADNSFELVSK